MTGELFTGRTERLLHLYPSVPAKPGDRALCGRVKDTPSKPIRIWSDHPDVCHVCEAMRIGAKA